MQDITAFHLEPSRIGNQDAARTSLLRALDRMLAEGWAFEELSLVVLARRAGVARSRFYRIFESKAFAVATLAEPHVPRLLAGATMLTSPGSPERSSIRSGLEEIFETVRESPVLFRALFDARADPAFRRAWDEHQRAFVQALALLIGDERAQGSAPPGADAITMARLLIDVTTTAIERALAADGSDARDALAELWLRSIYATDTGLIV